MLDRPSDCRHVGVQFDVRRRWQHVRMPCSAWIPILSIFGLLAANVPTSCNEGLPKSQQAAQEPSNLSRTLQYLK